MDDATGEQAVRVLVLEDEPAQRAMLLALLADEGFQASGCASGRQALEQLRGGDFGVAVIDLSLPDIGVPDLLAGLGSLGNRVSWIIHTGYGSYESARAAANLGVCAFVEKLGDSRELLLHVHRAARRQADRLAREALRESEERFRQLFDNMTAGVAVYEAVNDGENFLFKDFNRAAERIDQIARQDLIGKTVTHVFPGVRALGLLEVFQRVWRTGVSEHHPCSYYQDGRIQGWRENRVYRLPRGEIVAIYNDVTARRRAEEALRESEERYRRLVETSPDGVFINRGNKLAYINPAGLALLGASRPEQVLGRSVFDFIHPDWHTAVRERIRKEFETGRPVPPLEQKYLRLDGTPIDVEVAAGPIMRGGEQATQAILRDISVRKRAEESLRESEAKYRELFENAREAIVILDWHGRITDVNPFVEEYGFRRPDLIGCRPLDFVVAPYREKAVQDWQLLRQGIPQEGERELLTPKGKIGVHYLDSPIVRKGRVTGVLSVITDITGRKKAEQRLLKYQGKLRALAARLTLAEEQERRRIAVGVHDQIGQRMALVKLALQSLRASTKKCATRIIDGVCHDIDDVIANTHSLTYELSNPVLHEAGFVSAVESWLAEQIRDRHGIEYTFEADPRTASIDKETGIALFQIVRELLANVIKHAKTQHVHVRIREVGKKVEIVVQDEGVGFDPAGMGKPDSQTGGYGLFSIRERLEYFRGGITIESAPGQGTRISITAPLRSRRKPGGKEASP